MHEDSQKLLYSGEKEKSEQELEAEREAIVKEMLLAQMEETGGEGQQEAYEALAALKDTQRRKNRHRDQLGHRHSSDDVTFNDAQSVKSILKPPSQQNSKRNTNVGAGAGQSLVGHRRSKTTLVTGRKTMPAVNSDIVLESVTLQSEHRNDCN